jgi:preprotein translocase subunit SecA
VKISSKKYIDEAIKENPSSISRKRIIYALWKHIDTVLKDRSALEQEKDKRDEQEKEVKSQKDALQITEFGIKQKFGRYCPEDNEPEQWDYDTLIKEITSDFDTDIHNVEVEVDKYLKDMTEADFNEMAWLVIRKDLWLSILITYEERTFSKDSDEAEENESEPETDSAAEEISSFSEDTFRQIFEKYITKTKDLDKKDQDALIQEIQSQFTLDIAQAMITSGYYIKDAVENEFRDFSEDEVELSLLNDIRRYYKENKELVIGSVNWRIAERYFMLQVIDSKWKDHLLNIDHLKEGIGLRSYAQKDPLLEFKHESFRLFEEMQIRIGEEVVSNLYRLADFDYASVKNWRKKKKSMLAKPTSKIPTGKKKKGKTGKKKEKRKK